MKRFFLIACVGFLLFSCKSKRAIITKRGQVESIQKPVVLEHEEPAVPNIESIKVDKTTLSTTEQYIEVYKGIAQQEMQLYNIPASITLAQGILESGSGKGRLSVQANNHFGIKCHGWTGGKIYHDDDAKGECFRKYKDAKYSFRDHSLFLKDRKRYAKLFQLKQEDYKGWARGLRAAGYATDKKYPEKLISLIERYRLYEYDQDVLGSAYVDYIEPIKTENSTYIVQKGDTLYSISKRYNTSVQRLQQINGLAGTSLSIGQELQIE